VTILGLLPADYAWFFSLLGVLATFAGQTAVDFVIKKCARLRVMAVAQGRVL